ncbi:protein kinase domain-containing protein [Paenibacillus ferrarius]|uniref:protein kinase domain-containing protein n=1 Tax=Paenibacillus ferrarius TaxID=1469647 RepID=UPI003D29BCEE
MKSTRINNLFLKYLKKRYGYINVRQYMPSNELNFQYYVGTDVERGKTVFIKMYGNLAEVARREALLLQLLERRTRSKYFPKLLAYNVKGKYPFVVLEYVQGATSLDTCLSERKIQSQHHKRQLLRQMNDILQILHTNKIIHRDIRPANLLVRRGKDGKQMELVLIDFAFSVLKHPSHVQELAFLKSRRDILEALGEKSYKPSAFKWDDAYSFCKIAREIDSQSQKKFPYEWRQLNSSIGKVVYASKS